jgi:hypothetical protein
MKVRGEFMTATRISCPPIERDVRPVSAAGPRASRYSRQFRESVPLQRLTAILPNLASSVEQLGVDAVAFDQTMKVIPTPTAALVALDVEHVELADQVAEYDCAFTWHHSRYQP